MSNNPVLSTSNVPVLKSSVPDPEVIVVVPAVAAVSPMAIPSTSRPSVSVMATLPDVVLVMSIDPAVVSIAPPLPIPVTADSVISPVEASISKPAPPSASVIPLLVEVMLTAVVPAFVVTKRPTAIDSSADKLIVSSPALITVPSTIVIAPPDPASAVTSSSAVKTTAPLVVVMSPSASKIMSSSAFTVTVPVADDIPSLINTRDVPPTASNVIVPAPTAITAFPAPALSTVIVPSATMPMLPAVCCCALNTVIVLVSSMSMSPDVALVMSIDPTSVSNDTPVFELITKRPAASTSSTPVAPASVIAPDTLVKLTAVVPAFVVTKRPTAIDSSADKLIVSSPASITVPSTIVIAPLAAPPASKSAVTVTFPAPVEVTSPAAPNITSSSAFKIMSAPELLTVSLILRVPPSANRVT